MAELDQATRDALLANRVKYLQGELEAALAMGDEARYVEVQALLEGCGAEQKTVDQVKAQLAQRVADVAVADVAVSP